MDIKSWFKLENRKGLSTVIATVLMILLVIISVGIVWTFVRTFVTERTDDRCMAVQNLGVDKVTIEDSYTCYNETSKEVQFSINVADVKIDSLLISILVEGNSKSFIITDNGSVVPNIRPYKGNYGDIVKLPGENEGKTYIAGGFTSLSKVDSIKIAPIIEGKQCDETDETKEIDSCYLYE